MTTNCVLQLDFDQIESDDLPLKLSALTHAARISRCETKCCLGPAGDGNSEVSSQKSSENSLKKSSGNTPPKPRKSNLSLNTSEQPVSPVIHKPIDYEAYDRYASSKLSEKQRRSLVRKELEEKRQQFLLQQKAKSQQLTQLQHTEESPNDVKFRIEQLILQEAETLASELIAENERRLREQEEENRKYIEQLKVHHAVRQHHALLKAIHTFQLTFEEKYDEFSKKIRTTKPSERIEKLKQAIIPLLMKYNALNEKMRKAMNEIDSSDLQLIEQLVADIDTLRKQFDADLLADAAETVVDSSTPTIVPESPAPEPVAEKPIEQAQPQAQFPQQQQPQITAIEQPQPSSNPPPPAPAPSEDSGRNRFVSPENLAWYNNINAFYHSKVEGVKPLQANEVMKKYRSNCQKAVNIPVNAISAVSPEHLQDKYDKLYGLISGATVNTSDGPISVMDHPLGRDFCLLLLAKKFVSQGDSTVSSNPQAAFPIAAIIVSIWQKVPEFGQLFLAYTFKESPYLVPYFMTQVEDQPVEDYLKTLGYRFPGGALEKQDMYLKRQSGLIKLYAAVMVTKPRASDGNVHPFGIEHGWRWLNNILNLEPLPDICATLILGFLQTAGFEMLRIYRNQFLKLLRTLQNQYMQRLSKVDEGGPKARLEVFLMKVIKENTIEKPPGLLAPNFW